jgi:hypothetical protein
MAAAARPAKDEKKVARPRGEKRRAAQAASGGDDGVPGTSFAGPWTFETNRYNGIFLHALDEL